MQNIIKVRLDEHDSQRISNVEKLLLELKDQINAPKEEDDRWIDIKEVAKMIGFSQTTIKEKMNAGLFPKPNNIYTRNRWSYLEIKSWMSEQIQNQ